jgi:hypothetical protein
VASAATSPARVATGTTRPHPVHRRPTTRRAASRTAATATQVHVGWRSHSAAATPAATTTVTHDHAR